MKVFQNLLLFMLICEIVELCKAQIMDNALTSNKLDLQLQQVLVKILKDCNKHYDTLLIHSDSMEIDFRSIQELQTTVSVILHHNLSIIIKEYNPIKRLDAYVLIVQSLQRVRNFYMYFISTTHWMDVLMPFYVFTTETCNKSYRNYGNQEVKFFDAFFETMRVLKIVTSYLVCSDINGQIKIYTYNMFTDRALQQWNRVEKITEGRWTIYERDFIRDDICEELDFDRTKYLDGHKLVIAIYAHNQTSEVQGKLYNRSIIDTSPKTFVYNQVFLINALTKALNINCSIYFNTPLKITRKPHSWEQRFLSALINFSFDIFLMGFLLDAFVGKQYKGTYPLLFSEYVIMTHHRGYQTFIEKFRDFYGTWTISFTVLVIK